MRWGRSTRLLLPVLRESILKLLWLKHQALMHGPVQKRDAVSRNIQRSLAMQTWQSKLAHAVNKALHCTCVNCSGLGLKAIAVCPAFICWRKCHCFGINLSCNTAIRKHSRNLLAKVTLFSVFTGAEIEKKEAKKELLIHTALPEVTQQNAPHIAHARGVGGCVCLHWFLPGFLVSTFQQSY